jgi:predicted nucleic acid-binding protein
MPKPRAYVETTIPSFYYDYRDSPAVILRREVTRTWWTTAAERYALVTSTIVTAELAAATSDRVPPRLALLAQMPTLEFVPPVAEIVRHYLQHKLMPTKPVDDAVHLALASYYRCDLIVTWNCRHLANPNKAGHIRKINMGLGIAVPRLVTPQELLQEEVI